MFDCIVVGAGFAGAVIARKLAEDLNKRVLVIDRRNHIGGNMYDYYNEVGILVHKYGPHIYHTNSEVVHNFLSRFTEWYEYKHEVLGYIDGIYTHIPFNLNSLKDIFKDKELNLKEALINEFSYGSKIPILELRKHTSKDIRRIADFVYEKIFLNYTKKQWGLQPEEIDETVTARVPVYISNDNRYFQDKYQGIPLKGYTELFKNLLNHSNIEVLLNTDCKNLIKIDLENKLIFYNNINYKGILIYTGSIDELLEYKYGILPYRSLEFKFETYNKSYYQKTGTINYPNDYEYTRITEFKYLTGQYKDDITSITKEYPLPYNKDSYYGNIPYYPIITKDYLKSYEYYRNKLKDLNNLYLIGRLAEFKYYNMDNIVFSALGLYEQIAGELNGR